MSTIQLHRTTTLTPEQYVAGLTDFGPGRAKLFGNSTDEYLNVHSRGPSKADRRFPIQQRIPGRPIHASRLGVLDPVRHEDNDGRAGLCPRSLPDRFRC